MGGLAVAILLASLCIGLVPSMLLGALTFFVLRKTRARWPGAIVAALLGAGVGALAVTATFYESVWEPPSPLVFEVPPGFRHESVVLILDPTVSAEVDWSGVSMPFVARRGRVTVPASGVVRLRELDSLTLTQVDASLSTNVPSTGRSGFSDPTVGYGLVYLFVPSGAAREPDLGALEPAALVALIREREAER